jgi:ADP-heptose:LPS heptosyltransferase
MVKLLKKVRTPQIVSIKRFNEIKNKVLVNREVGGLGDILMHRMMFEDFKRVMPDAHIVWGVPPDYIPIAEGHPFVDEVVDCRKVNIEDFILSYNTTTACGRHEIRVAPNSDKHRSDIWANHCGVILTRHNMHLKIKPECKQWAMEKIKQASGGKPSVLFSPISAQRGKNLNDKQMAAICKYLQGKGFFVFASHTSPIYELNPVGVPTFWGHSLPQWAALVDSADYTVSVDTAAFHCAGGLGKPLTGIFTYIDGKTYGKYFKFSLVQKHRDNGDWDCGPCFNWPNCPKCPAHEEVKPCATEITTQMMVDGVERMFQIWPNTLH